MMWKILCLALCLTGCGEIERTFAPDVIEIERTLDESLTNLLEVTLREEVCPSIEERDFECNIPEQIKSVEFTWLHNPEGEVVFKLKFCLKDNCPLEIVE